MIRVPVTGPRDTRGMGKNNRQRRADNQRRRATEEKRRVDRSGAPSPRDLADALLWDAAEAAEHGATSDLERLVEGLTAMGPVAGMALTSLLATGLRVAWEGGWQPVDIVRAAVKRLGKAQGQLAAELITLEANARGGGAVPSTWAAQLSDLRRPPRSDGERWSDPQAFRMGVGLLGLLARVPVLPPLGPPPSQWGKCQPSAPSRASVDGRVLDGRVLDKVRALLVKAESTEFPAEAEAFTAKAQDLMARYAIDHARLTGRQNSEAPSARRIGVDDPYADGKANLLAEIAAANRCQAVWLPGYGFSTVVGFATDLEIVEVLYLSLLVQATRVMAASGSRRDSAGRSRTRSFRQSFMLSFAVRIGERLREVTDAATEDAVSQHGEGDLLPVLAGRRAAVDESFAAMFPHLVPTSNRISNLSGWAAGRAAADLAQLGREQPAFAGVAG